MTDTERELPEELYSGIQRLCAAGDDAGDRGDFNDALAFYNRALTLVPPPRTEWEASTWIHAAMGDTYFHMRDLSAALSAFEEALRSPNGLGNPFLHLRRGQVLFDIGHVAAAADELARAYMAEGEAIFRSEDAKYLTYIKSVLRPQRS